ncbi:hypothetical protein GOP47_0004931 [Adiantum capillus-veneris]|nr:hypothetical protein GOP47_0004931 [Adiantum capillus-veneris]
MNPVDDSIAPNYSKVIKNPMCFLRMQHKVFTEQYTSWLAFVEDFKLICYNAMTYNQKRSQIWNAANLMLRQGKRCLEQQFSKHSVILGLNRMHKGHNHQEKIAADATLGPVAADVLACKNPGAKIQVTADRNFESRERGRADQMIAKDNSSVCEVDVAEENMAYFSPAKSLTKNVSGNIVRPEPEENSRILLDDQATEYSSSFSGTQSELEDDYCTVDSELRDGNGANAPTTENISKRKKRALDGDWKLCKQGIEWRCRWLKLQIQMLQAESNKYRRIAELHKSECQQDSDVGVNTTRCRVLRRRCRRRVEENVDSMLDMSVHPVFSRYEKQNHHNQESSSTEEAVRHESWKKLEFDDFDFDAENDYEDNIVLEKDSIEQYLWQIEALQMQISDLKDQLTRNSPTLENETYLTFKLDAPQNISGLSTRVHLSRRSVARELKGQGGTPSSRRRTSDFDINNVIMPDSLMANYVQPARHVFIETPHWRVIAESAAQDELLSSEEDTDDEVYIARHAHMQAQERQSLYSPLALNKSRNLSTTKERPKSSSTRRGALANAVSVKDLQPAIPTIFGYIPKRKRRKRDWKQCAASGKDPLSALDKLKKHSQ